MTPPSRADALPRLPVLEVLAPLRRALATARGAVLVAPPGAGKTTLVPLALLDEGWLEGRQILLLEPRRLAARAAAWRMTDLLGEKDVGGTVGYRVRLDTRVGPDTRIEVATEGVLTRMLQEDPGLQGTGLLVFDEFHERSLHADLGLALGLQARALLRPDLRILVMSATMDPGPVAALLGGAPVVKSSGRSFPVETRWRSRPVEGWIEPAVASAVRAALERDPGDVLAFLPGGAEIRRTAARLVDEKLPEGVSLHPLYGDLPRAEQDRALAPAPAGRRKVVLATTLAETSLTIEGVRVVVDSGLVRVPRFDPGSGMTRLETVRVSRDGAEQRRGRAGRTAPGVCYRLWTRDEERGLTPHRTPEIREADLAPLALELAVWGADPDELEWLDPPPAGGMAQARELLRELEAVDLDGAATDHGRTLARLGLHPRLAHMLVKGSELGLGSAACDLAAVLSDRDLIRSEGPGLDRDLRHRVEVVARARRGSGQGGSGPVPGLPGHRVDGSGLRRAVRESRHWHRRLGLDPAGGGPDDAAATGALAALAFPDRVARRREGGAGRFLLRNGRGASFLDTQPLAGTPWLVAAELDDRGADARIFLAAPVDEAQVRRLFHDQLVEEATVEWDSELGRVQARRRRRLGAVVVDDAPLEAAPPAAVVQAVLEGIRQRGLDVLKWDRDNRQLADRLRFLAALEPGQWPPAGDDDLLGGLEDWLAPFLAGVRSLEDLARVDPGPALLARLTRSQRERLDRLAPTHLTVPSGSRLALDYSDPESPALDVKLQEVFGLTETPRVGGGRVPILLRLLSPARRPVQVTRDLASFWKDAYFEVRKELRGRYPKHPWPEDPLEAPPTARTRRRS